MLKILHTEASTGWGGQEIRILQESLGMIRRGSHVAIAAPEWSCIYKKAKESGLEVYHSDFSKANPFSLVKFVRIIKKFSPQIINTHSSKDSWAASAGIQFLTKKPVLIRTRHLSTPVSRSFLSRFLYNILPDAVITTGEEIRRQMVQNNKFNPLKIVSIPTGINIDRFDPEKVKPSFNKKNDFSVGMIGVLRSWKGHRYFLESIPAILKAVPNTKFYIAGSGPQLNNIKNLIITLSLNDNVIMLGHREDIPEIIASLDIIAHPSYSNEGVPQSILQALSMGKAVIASNIKAINEVIINGETGLSVEPRDPSSLSEAVIKLLNNSELRNRLGQNGIRLVHEKYTDEIMLDKIESLYSSIIAK
ncbi:MAG: glycosyltransferase family 4 protein [Nitrospiraceae bacterium]|nr:glycosyltransferase family 4 protein [Nitrospiraceae bacterium]